MPNEWIFLKLVMLGRPDRRTNFGKDPDHILDAKIIPP